MQKNLKDIYLRLKAAVVFSNITLSPTMSALSDYLKAIFPDSSADEAEKIEKYSHFIRLLFPHAYSLGDFLLTEVYEDENIYIKSLTAQSGASDTVRRCAETELDLFTEISALTHEELTSEIKYGGFIPKVETKAYDFRAKYTERLSNIDKYGYGIFARHTMFNYSDGKIIPVTSADKTRISDLFGYERERQEVIDNTSALILGKGASNVLLYGDAGTGKSSTVKAVANMFSPQGVRLIELRKEQIICIPEILERLCGNPLKFIIFIDDLSFTENDGSLGTLKAILEGSASARSSNTVIYVTSNRRHLVRESFSDRVGDDVHRRDTLQENISLSERFGVTVLFSRPDKKTYFEIVKNLAGKKGIHIPQDELTSRADAYALKKGGYSPRAAEQFTNILLAGT